MKKEILLKSGFILIIIGIFICVYPNIEFYKDNYLYMMSYSKTWEESEDLKELEQELCYNESYSYNKKRDISITGWEYKNFLFFKWLKISYKTGNLCDTEYLLEESYITHFLKNAEIKDNDDNINLSHLIEGKKAIVANKRYPWNDNNSYISYILDGKYMEMFLYTTEEGVVVIQVGLGDEGPKYIAYK